MKEITYIEPASLGKIFGTLTFGITLLWIIPADLALILQFFKGHPILDGLIMSVLGLAIFPGLAYVSGIILGYMYNFVAKRIGGIELFSE